MANISAQIESLFAAAIELSGESRKAFLDRECAGQDELRHQLEGLLLALDEALSRFTELDPPTHSAFQEPQPAATGLSPEPG